MISQIHLQEAVEDSVYLSAEEGEVAMDVGGEAIKKDTGAKNTTGEAMEEDGETPVKTEGDTIEGEADLKAEVVATEEVATTSTAGDLAIDIIDANKSV